MPILITALVKLVCRLVDGWWIAYDALAGGTAKRVGGAAEGAGRLLRALRSGWAVIPDRAHGHRGTRRGPVVDRADIGLHGSELKLLRAAEPEHPGLPSALLLRRAG